MAPPKKSNGAPSTASRRYQAAALQQHARYGIQHFFTARHHSDAADHPVPIPIPTPPPLTTALPFQHSPHSRHQPSSASAPPTAAPLLNSSLMTAPATRGQIDVSVSSTKDIAHNMNLKKIDDVQNVASEEKTKSLAHKPSELIKRRRLSPGMLQVIQQSQDDGGEEVVWKVSPTAERLLSTSVKQTRLHTKEKFALHPCQNKVNQMGTMRGLNASKDISDVLGGHRGVSPHSKASPGMAGKLEQWLSFGGNVVSDGSRSLLHISSILVDSNKENNDMLNLSPIVTLRPLKHSKSARTPSTKLRYSLVGGCLNKKCSSKQAKSGERRKALLQLLDQVQDVVASEKSTSELLPEESLVSHLAQENASDTAESINAKQAVAEKRTSPEHAGDVMEGIPSDDSKPVKTDKVSQTKCAEKLSPLDRSSMPSLHSPCYLRLPDSGLPHQTEAMKLCSASMGKINCYTVQEKYQGECTQLPVFKPPQHIKAEKQHSLETGSQSFGVMQDIEDHGRTVLPSRHLQHHVQKASHKWLMIHFLVLEVSEGPYLTKFDSSCLLQKILILLNEENGIERAVNLRDEWVYTVVRPGDAVNVIGEFDMDGTMIVDHDHNFLIVNPDILISGSRVGASFTCPRRAVLDERIQSSNISMHALMGTLLHRLFQAGLRMDEPKRELLEHEALFIVQRHIDSLYAITGNEKEAHKKLVESIPLVLDWLHRFRNPSPSTLVQVDFGRANGQRQLSISQVLDIEEMIWSPRFGMKGMIDASLKIKSEDHTLGKDIVMPLEFKTGKGMSGKAAMEHRAQVMLYTLLMSDRYAKDIKEGLLFYLHTNETQGICAQHGDLASLLIRRNEHASNVLAASSSQILPSMLQNLHICQGCRSLDICTVYHKGQGGTAESSGLGELFDSQTSHLTKNHHEFLQHWEHLIDLEAHGVYASQSEIWRTPSSIREEQGRCLSSMMLDLSTCFSEDKESPNSRFVYCFRRVLSDAQSDATPSKVEDTTADIKLLVTLQDRPFSSGDFVLLSTESGHVAIASGYIVSINMNSVLISFPRRLRLPENSADSETGGLLKEIWRIDKDEIGSSWSIMRNNLLQLFVKNGDEQRRRLIVDLEKPRFDVSGLLSQDPAIMYTRSLLGVNDDQRRAILKILAARDYALILGMPGTGKTSTIVHAVQALCARGASVLLASYTNSAVDNILLKLKLQNIDFIRVGRLEAVHPELQENVIGSGSKMTSVRQLRTKVDQAQVVGCTCLGITHAIFCNRKFDVCIVDEAGQITLPVILGPLRCANTFVLVGDHYQLPPLVRNPEAREKGMSVSLFRRLSEAHPEAVSALHSQYRMCSDIMALCNQLIYGHRLRCGSVEVANAKLELAYPVNQAPKWLQQVLNASNCVIFMNTDCLPAYEQHVKNAVKNVIEASILMKTVRSLVTGGVPVQSIGVISPYNAQVDTILKLSTENGLSELEVHTVDKYQGRDKDCVLLSFVRSNEQYRSSGSLLADWHRINVAVTRAKKKLIMIGSQMTLSSIPLMRLLIDEVKNVGALINLPHDAIASIHPLQRCSSFQQLT